MFTSAQLLEVAAQAELLRLRQEARLLARNAAFMAAAGLFVLFVIALLHVSAVTWIAGQVGYAAAALWVALGDAIIACLLFLLSRKRDDPVAMEALRIRRRALHEIGSATIVGDVFGALRRGRRPSTFAGSVAETVFRSIARR